MGIAKDIRNLTYNLDKPIGPFYFLPEAQHDVSEDTGFKEVSPGSHFLHDIVIVTKPGTSLSDCAGAPRHGFGGSQSAGHFDSHSERASGRPVHPATADCAPHFVLRSSFAGLASIGLYGVTAYNAGCRTNEIGVRMALGADRGDVVSLVLRGAFALILFGLLLGLPLIFAVGRFLGNQLYGMSPYNPVVTLAAILALGLSAMVASFIPAFRASSISPLDALRTE